MTKGICPRCYHEMIPAGVSDRGQVSKYMLCVVCGRRENVVKGAPPHLAGRIETKQADKGKGDTGNG